MKNLHVAFISNDEFTNGMSGISSFLNNAARHSINALLWSDNGYKPSVSFAMAYTEDAILLKYFVTERYVTANYRRINDPVYKDSCVEFFIAFGNDENYYNLEFNAIGSALIAYGPGKEGRRILDESTISKIKNQYTITTPANDEDDTKWELTLRIPFNIFIHNSINSLTGKRCRANFYKCGDDLTVPHYLSWNYLYNPQPNFHLPRFFGSIMFQ